MQIAKFTDKINSQYKYMRLSEKEADVFIYKFIEENKTEEGTEYIYEFNQFKVNTDEITEEMIKENPLDYLNYSSEVISPEEEIIKLKSTVRELEKKVEKLEKQ